MAKLSVKILEHQHFILLFIVLILCTHVPSSSSTYVADDYMHGAIFGGSERLKALGFENVDPALTFLEKIENGFHFFNQDKKTLTPHKEYGNMPWWSVDQATMQPFRPVAALTHWFDHQVLHGDIHLMLWHSLCYLVFFALAGLLLYRHLHADPVVCGIAALMLVFDMSVSANFSWVAARNSYFAAGIGMLTFYFFIRWREEGKTVWFMASLLGLLTGLLTAEAMVAIGAYLMAYTLCVEKKGWRRALLTLIPYAAIVLVWRAAYNMGGMAPRVLGYIRIPVGICLNLLSSSCLFYH